MSRSWLLQRVAFVLVLASGAACVAGDDVGPLVRSIWLIQRFGDPAIGTPGNDRILKGKLAKALGKESILTAKGIVGLMEPSTFTKLAGVDGVLDAKEVAKALEFDIPASRNRLNPKIVAHVNLLTTSFDMIDEPHQKAGDQLVDWIVKNYKSGQPLHITIVCTGNSRRSILGATMGNIASAYYGMPEVRFHSGGTAPTAFNSRTITALKEIGVEVEPLGKEAPRGEPKTPNPIYRVSWGQPGEPALEILEFSKSYFDAANPQKGFAALLVCSEADEACPAVLGASARISMPYLDPKIFDGSTFETQKYAERRDDIGRLMLSVMMRVRNQAVSTSLLSY